MDWIGLLLPTLLCICILWMGIKSERHYRKGEYPQAIYNMLFVIFMMIAAVGSR